MSNPHRYEWHAVNAQQAINILEAAMALIEARLKVLAPDETFAPKELRLATPIGLTIILDEAAAVLAASKVDVHGQPTRITP